MASLKNFPILGEQIGYNFLIDMYLGNHKNTANISPKNAKYFIFGQFYPTLSYFERKKCFSEKKSQKSDMSDIKDILEFVYSFNMYSNHIWLLSVDILKINRFIATWTYDICKKNSLIFSGAKLK